MNISESCQALMGCSKPYPLGIAGGNHVTTQKHAGGGFTIEVRAYNSAALGVAPAINASVTFKPDGTTSGVRDAMPALGIYRQQQGEWKPLQERYQAGGLFLLPGMPKDRW